MTPTHSINILCTLRTEKLRLQQKAMDRGRQLVANRCMDEAAALGEGIKALQLARDQATAGAFDPLPCGGTMPGAALGSLEPVTAPWKPTGAKALQFIEDLRKVISPDQPDAGTGQG
jgi:hypothetical protein